MEILKDLIDSIKEDVQVEEVRRGLHWTAVVSRQCGLASTQAHSGCAHDETAGMDGSFTDMTALELARHCLNGEPDMASLCVAAINSLLDVDADRYADMDGLKLVKDIGKGKNIAIIGHFPFLDDLAHAAKNLWIIEKQPRPGDYSEEKGRDLLPQADIIAISSTTLINNTIGGILSLCSREAVKMLLGPTTPLSKVLFAHGIDVLAGSVVTDKDRVLKSVSEGISFMQLKRRGGVRFVSMVKDYDDIVRRLGRA